MSDWNDALEWAAQTLEAESLLDKYGDCFNQSKPGCAAILADLIRAGKGRKRKLPPKVPARRGPRGKGHL